MRDNALFRLEGKVVAVIGAASGIGRAAAVGCARQGGRLVCLDLDAEASGEAAQQIVAEGGEAESAGLDIRDPGQVEAIFGDIVDRRGRLDVVICTPSINVRKPILAYEEDEFDRVVELNLKGSFHILQTVGRFMEQQKAGSIIVFSSIRSVVVEPGQAVYAATKAGIVQMVRTLAAELGPAGVRVNAIAPGVVDTPLTAPIKANREWYEAYAAKSVFGRWAHVEEMVGPTVFLASEAASYITGSVLFVDGGWTAADGRFQPPGI